MAPGFPSPVTIRPASASDARGIAGVHVRTWQAAYRRQLPDDLLDRLSVDQRARFWDRVFAQVGEVGEGGEAQARAILAYLDGKRQVDVKAKRYAARLMADTGKLSQREIAAQLKIAQSTVSKWLQASKAGEPAS